MNHSLKVVESLLVAHLAQISYHQSSIDNPLYLSPNHPTWLLKSFVNAPLCNASLPVDHHLGYQSYPVRPLTYNASSTLVPYAPKYHKWQYHRVGEIYPSLLLQYEQIFYTVYCYCFQAHASRIKHDGELV